MLLYVERYLGGCGDGGFDAFGDVAVFFGSFGAFLVQLLVFSVAPYLYVYVDACYSVSVCVTEFDV